MLVKGAHVYISYFWYNLFTYIRKEVNKTGKGLFIECQKYNVCDIETAFLYMRPVAPYYYDLLRGRPWTSEDQLQP